MAKTSRTKIIAKIDKKYSEKRRDQIGYCEKCGRKENLQLAHIHSRRNLNIRWDDENTVILCYACHMHWAHKEPIQFTRWIETFKDLEYLDEKIREARPIKTNELEVLLQQMD